MDSSTKPQILKEVLEEHSTQGKRLVEVLTAHFLTPQTSHAGLPPRKELLLKQVQENEKKLSLYKAFTGLSIVDLSSPPRLKFGDSLEFTLKISGDICKYRPNNPELVPNVSLRKETTFSRKRMSQFLDELGKNPN